MLASLNHVRISWILEVPMNHRRYIQTWKVPMIHGNTFGCSFEWEPPMNHGRFPWIMGCFHWAIRSFFEWNFRERKLPKIFKKISVDMAWINFSKTGNFQLCQKNYHLNQSNILRCHCIVFRAVHLLVTTIIAGSQQLLSGLPWVYFGHPIGCQSVFRGCCFGHHITFATSSLWVVGHTCCCWVVLVIIIVTIYSTLIS